MFRELSINAMSKSPLMTSRTKCVTEDIIEKELTIIDFDMVDGVSNRGEKKIYPVIIFKELDDVFYNGGAILGKLCRAWIESFDGDIDACRAALREEGVKVKLHLDTTREGNKLVTVEII